MERGTKSSMFYPFMFMNFSTAEEFFKCKATWERLAESLYLIGTLPPPYAASSSSRCLLTLHFLWVFFPLFSEA